MSRLPYEVVAIEADRLIIKMATCATWDEAFRYWDIYLDYIESCGWTDQEFDTETIKRIDAGWRPRFNWN